MERRSSILILKICVCIGILAVGILGSQLWQEKKESEKIYSCWMQAGDREISGEFLQQIADRKGVQVVSAAWEIPVHLAIDSYEMDAVLLAVDMDVVPVAIKKCAERLETGSKIPMYLGSDSLLGLMDENQHLITEKQRKLLFEQGIGKDIMLQGGGGIEKMDKSLKTTSQTGIWAAERKDGGAQIWVSLEEGQKLAESLKITQKTHKIYIEVRGKREYQNLCSVLEQTGMVLQNE